MKHPAIATRILGSLWIPGVVLLFPVAAFLLRSTPWLYLGLVVVAVALRFRNRPAGWEYACFGLAGLAGGAWLVMSASSTYPWLGAVPLMLSYVFDYLVERRDKRAAPATADPLGGRGPAAPNAPPADKATRT